jgi:hypothetical protein
MDQTLSIVWVDCRNLARGSSVDDGRPKGNSVARLDRAIVSA